MSDVMADLRRHNADYGFDGSYQTVSARGQATIFGACCVGLLAFAGFSIVNDATLAAVVAVAVTVWLSTGVASFIHTTRVGKFAVWARVLAELGLRGDERLLDLGCGRGAVLLSAAKLLPRGRAVGVDLWRADQTDNSPDATLANAELEGVAERVELHTADLRQLPFGDDSIDVIVSSLAIHNIPNPAGRRQAIDEAVRVLRPGGRLAIADLWATRKHATRLRELGLADVQRRGLGWRMWWGGPGFPTHLVTARKPDRSD